MAYKNRLSSSGIMTNYQCSAACRHCMYAGTPRIKREYITPQAAGRIAGALSAARAGSVHIGGGEPFLDFEGLVSLIEALNRHGISIDYIETNASFCTSPQIVRSRLSRLRDLGSPCVMASIDPFHIEYIPLSRPLLLIEELSRAGMEHFIWQERFLARFRGLDPARPHTHEGLKAHLGADYLQKAAREYGLGVNGRAFSIARTMYPLRPARSLLSSTPCHLLDGRHCHIDLYENVVPGGCPGIAISLPDFLNEDVPLQTYPVAARLLSGGVAALWEYAKGLGFAENPEGYVSGCELCVHMRLMLQNSCPSADVGPACFYEAMGEVF